MMMKRLDALIPAEIANREWAIGNREMKREGKNVNERKRAKYLWRGLG